jgi:hypothetical protein
MYTRGALQALAGKNKTENSFNNFLESEIPDLQFLRLV